MSFAVGTWQDRVRVPPQHLGGPPASALAGVLASGGASSVTDYLERELDATYANRVIPGTGLALSVWSVDAVSEPLILPGDGGVLPTGE
jgi:DNA-directed RNA polymerase subunit E'/Rpb7